MICVPSTQVGKVADEHDQLWRSAPGSMGSLRRSSSAVMSSSASATSSARSGETGRTTMEVDERSATFRRLLDDDHAHIEVGEAVDQAQEGRGEHLFHA